jgi:hypothetical protein
MQRLRRLVVPDTLSRTCYLNWHFPYRLIGGWGNFRPQATNAASGQDIGWCGVVRLDREAPEYNQARSIGINDYSVLERQRIGRIASSSSGCRVSGSGMSPST